MLSFTPVSGKEEGKRRKEREEEQGGGCNALHPVASVSSWLTQPGITRKVPKLQVAKAEAPYLHQASHSLNTTADQKWTGREVDREGSKQGPWVTGMQLTQTL